MLRERTNDPEAVRCGAEVLYCVAPGEPWVRHDPVLGST
jgi:hypothetical protein